MNVSLPPVQTGLLGEAIDHGPVLVFLADEEMNYVAVNQYACDVLGYTREELLTLKVTDVSPDGDTPKRFAAFLADPNGSGRATIRHKDGAPLTLDYRASETTVAGMTLYVSIGILRD